MLIELNSLGVTFSYVDGAWALEDNVMRAAAEENKEEETEKAWEHEDINIRMPSLIVPKEASFQSDYVLYFDGAYSKGKGAGGVLVYNANAQCLGGQALYFGDTV